MKEFLSRLLGVESLRVQIEMLKAELERMRADNERIQVKLSGLGRYRKVDLAQTQNTQMLILKTGNKNPVYKANDFAKSY